MHISFIMDGNGRWAKSRGKMRGFGHKEGANTLEKILKVCPSLGVKEATFYGFSTENQKRPAKEVQYILQLFENYLKSKIDELHASHVCFKVIGDREYFNDRINQLIAFAENKTKDNRGIRFNLAMNYGGRAELLQAVKLLSEDVRRKTISLENLDEDHFSKYLYLPSEPDLLIRTGGEKRLSNYLLWQHAYTEFIFTDTLWPDFTEEELATCIQEYKRRHRRYGGL